MNNAFQGLNILLYAPLFHGYEQLIKQHLEMQGATVDFVENKAHRFDYRAVNGQLRSLKWLAARFKNHIDDYITTVCLPQIKNQHYDLCLCINGYSVSRELLETLRTENPDITIVFYLWDSVAEFDWTDLTPYTDRVFSFDPVDCEQHGYQYLPNFYMETDAEDNATEPDIDLFFVGTQTFERYTSLATLLPLLTQHNISHYVKLLIRHQSPLHSAVLYRLFKSSPLKSRALQRYIQTYELHENITQQDFLITQPLPPAQVADTMLRSNTVLDLSSPYQHGYSHRIISSLAQGKKLLTTNRQVLKETFYNPHQIKILDADSLILDTDWIRNYEPFVSGHLLDCRIDNWLKTLLL